MHVESNKTNPCATRNGYPLTYAVIFVQVHWQLRHFPSLFYCTFGISALILFITLLEFDYTLSNCFCCVDCYIALKHSQLALIPIQSAINKKCANE